MTPRDYQSIRDMIETRFRQDMAALERVWYAINKVNPPDSPVALAPIDDTDNDAAIGVVEVARPTESKPRASYKGLSDEEKKARKAEYMRAYLKKRRAAGK